VKDNLAAKELELNKKSNKIKDLENEKSELLKKNSFYI